MPAVPRRLRPHGGLTATRNVSTTLIQPGSEFKLGYEAWIERGRTGRVRQRFVLAAAIRGSARRRAWVRVALRNGTQWRRPLECRAADTVDASCDARTEEGTGGFDDLE